MLGGLCECVQVKGWEDGKMGRSKKREEVVMKKDDTGETVRSREGNNV